MSNNEVLLHDHVAVVAPRRDGRRGVHEANDITCLMRLIDCVVLFTTSEQICVRQVALDKYMLIGN